MQNYPKTGPRKQTLEHWLSMAGAPSPLGSEQAAAELSDLHAQFFSRFQLPQALVQWHRPALT